MGERFFNHCLTDRDSFFVLSSGKVWLGSHSEDLAVVHTGLNKKRSVICPSPTNCDFSRFYSLDTVPPFFKAL